MTCRPLRVLFFTTSYPLRSGSASGIFVRRLVESLPEQVHVTVLTPCDTSGEPLSDNVHCFRYAPRRQQQLAHLPGGVPVALKQSKLMRLLLPLFLIAMLLSCFRLARKVDIIHANWSTNGALAGLVGRLRGMPIITTLRGEDITKARRSTLFRLLLATCLRSNDRVVTVSEAIRAELVLSYPQYEDKIVFIPNGVANEFLASTPKENETSSHCPFRLITIGSLIPRKGIDTLISALYLLQETGRSYTLKIIGAGTEEERLKELAEQNGIRNIVEFAGAIAPARIAQQFTAADAFILGSHSEGRPNVILESLATGVPVIATDIDGVRELIEDGTTGLLFKPGNARQLADRITQLAADRYLRLALAHNGKRYIDEHRLYWKDTGNRYARLYSEITGNRMTACAD